MTNVGDRRRSRTVLIVEDHDDLRRIMKEVLEYEGYDSVTATNGREALELLDAMDGIPALIMSDIVMDEMDGCQLFREIRGSARWGSVPFVFVSGKMQVETNCRELPFEADDYIEKPFSLQSLMATVQAIVKQ
jgi:two-component system response regulator MprA